MNRRVLIIPASTKIMPGGGPSGYVYNLFMGIQELEKKGMLTNRFDFFGECSFERVKPAGGKKAGFSMRGGLVDLLTYFGVKQFFSKRIRSAKKRIFSSDVIVFQGFQEPCLSYFAKKIGKTIIYMPHSPSIMADERKMTWDLTGVSFEKNVYDRLKHQEAELIENSSIVIFPSEGASEEYIISFPELLDEKKIVFIPSGVHFDESNLDSDKSYDDAKSNIQIVFVGRYVSHKGYDLFCDAVELIHKESIGVSFVTVGDGPMERDSNFIINLGWCNNVFEILRKASVVVVPNRVAYYDLLPLECAALGKPLVMTYVGGNIEQLKLLPDTVACKICRPYELAEAIKVAVQKTKVDAKWGERNRRTFDVFFNSYAFAKRWDDAILCLTNEVCDG